MKNLVNVNIKTQKKFLRDFPKKNWIIFYYWNNCGFCHRINPVWDNLVKQSRNSNFKFAKVERETSDRPEFKSFLEKNNTIIPYFPFFMKYINEGGKKSNEIIPNIEEEFKNNHETTKKSENIKLLKSNEIKKSKKKKYKKPISGKNFLKKIKSIKGGT